MWLDNCDLTTMDTSLFRGKDVLTQHTYTIFTDSSTDQSSDYRTDFMDA